MTQTCPICQSPVGATDAQCGVCGFKLVGTTRGFVPVMPAEDEIPTGEKPTSAVLRTIRGPQIGADHELGHDTLTIGRNPSCNIFLNDMTVSREHATISYEGGCHVIRDNRSFNGVWVNNKSINAKALSDGDIVQIGAFAFVYEC